MLPEEWRGESLCVDVSIGDELKLIFYACVGFMSLSVVKKLQLCSYLV